MIIKEYLPNSVGKDSEGEYIKLLNDGSAAVNLDGWRLHDASRKIFKLDGYRLNSKEELVLDYKTTKIVLNNDGETISLYDSRGNLIDQLSFSGPAKEGAIILKNNPEFFETFPQASGKIISGGLSSQFWVLLILTGVILASLAVFLIQYYEKHYLKEQ